MELSSAADFLRIDQERARRYAARIVGDRGIAEDMVQDALLHVIQQGSVDEPQRYFYRALANTCVSELRRRRGIVATPAGLEDDVSSNEVCGHEHLGLVERTLAVEYALGELPERQRLAVVLKVWEGQSYGQIGVTLNVTENNAATLTHRGFVRLRQLLSVQFLENGGQS